MIFIQQSAGRLMRAMFEICLSKRWSTVALKVLQLCNMVERKMWCSQNALRQFHAVPDIIIRKLERVADISWEKYLDLKPTDLGEMVKNQKMGKTLYKFVHMLPKFSIAVHAVPITRSWLKLDISIRPEFDFNIDVHGSQLQYWLMVEDCDGEQVLYYEPQIYRGEEQLNYQCVVKLMDPAPPQYFVRIIADRWLHSTTEVPISFKHLILPEKFFPPTELLDLRPIPASALTEVHRKFLNKALTLNPIQTQLYFHLNDGDENVLIFGPPHSGKETCAEVALIRFLNSSGSDDRCVVLCPSEVGSFAPQFILTTLF
jgi:pre-mRNA-splicing helicase BRR2